MEENKIKLSILTMSGIIPGSYVGKHCLFQVAINRDCNLLQVIYGSFVYLRRSISHSWILALFLMCCGCTFPFAQVELADLKKKIKPQRRTTSKAHRLPSDHFLGIKLSIFYSGPCSITVVTSVPSARAAVISLRGHLLWKDCSTVL